MKATFVEVTGFTAALPAFLSDREYAALQHQLMDDPEAGDAMPGCGGLRKVRTPDRGRGKGKRGGARVIYLHVPAAKRFYMLDVYGKDEKDDLSAAEKKFLRRRAEQLKVEATAAYRRWVEENRR
jgi:hypothetical protein